MKKGFTLIELLAVIIVLGVITVIAVPAVNKAIKKGKEQLYEVQIKNIELGAKSWAAENAFDLPEEDGQVITLTLGQLKVAGFVELDAKNPVTETLFPNDMEVTITRQMNNYLYDVLEDSGTSTEDEGNIDLYSPTIILSGSASVYVEFGETYVEPGYTARNSSGVDITDQVTSEIKSNNTVVPSVDTTRFGQYKITYTVVDNERNASVIRTVTVEDTTAPELTIPSNITISNSEVATFNVMDGVSATDNTGEEVIITTTGNLSSIPGTYTILYTATDIKGNETIKTRTVKVILDFVGPGYVESKGVNGPDLFSGMTPIKWNGTDWVNTSITDPEWYDYSNKKWANVRTQDGSFWVWIPRYAYQISSGYHTNTPGTINIKFLIDNTNTTSDGTTIESTPTYNGDSQTNYVTHPAFIFREGFFTEPNIEGIWVAKFEPSVESLSLPCYTDESESNCNTSSITPRIVPNVKSWRYLSIETAFEVSEYMQNISYIYGWNRYQVKTRLMKNTEWGAVAYLSQSTYGKNAKISQNTNQNNITGCGDDGMPSTVCNAYDTAIGMEASTTGNIYGIYDMAGGSHERVSAYLDNGSSNLTNYGRDLLRTEDAFKNIYVVGATDSMLDNYEANSNVFGDAVYEISAADQGQYCMPFGSNPFFARGGSWQGGGIYAYNYSLGVPSYNWSFRPVVTRLLW